MNAVIYVRVSTAEQVETNSLENQTRSCHAFCEQLGLEVVRVFREEGESAKTTRRPQFNEMLDFCMSNRESVDFGVVDRIDRFARSSLDHHHTKQLLSKVGVELRSAKENFDQSPAGRMHEGMMATFAQYDNDLRSARTIEGMIRGLERGQWVFKPPIGYLRPEKGSACPSLVPDPEQGPLIRLAFELYSTGLYSKREVLRRVTDMGLSRRGKAVNPRTLSALLANPIYAGRVVSPGFGIDGPGDFEPIIDQETFDEVRKVSQSIRS